MNDYLPEGRLIHTPENRALLSTPAGLQSAMAEERVLEGLALRCDADHNLLVDCGGRVGIIPRLEAARGIAEGTTRDIAILSRVGRPVSFLVEGLEGHDGEITPLLSRRKAQDRALATLLRRRPGDILPAAVTHLEPFGAFVDLGCGVPSLIGLEQLSVSRIPHPDQRVRVGQNLYVLVTGVDPDRGRLSLSHRELLGTWEENAADFAPGETVPGVIRSIRDYGIFVELTPNLSGLAEPKAGLAEGQRVSVYLKSILRSRMKLKLLIIDQLPPAPLPPLRYFRTAGRLEHWEYAPAGCGRGAVWDAETVTGTP